MNRNATPPDRNTPHEATRREFLRVSTLGAGALMGSRGFAAHTSKTRVRPNILILFSDQLGLDALSAHGCADVHTPNIDRLVARGVTFMESHSTCPVCSPARSSIFTGRMPVETGVISNDRPINSSVAHMGQWFRQNGYDTFYCGKWHLPGGYPVAIDGFTVLPVGGGQGDLVDSCVSRLGEAYLKNRHGSTPFLFTASFMQPHDICYWAIEGKNFVPEELPFPALAGALPLLPPNHRARPRAPKELDRHIYQGFSDLQWRYYLHIYYRQIEMLDADVGRVLDALDDTGLADNTLIVFTADHGDGRGRHMHVSKWYPYEESVKVPMIVSWPGRVAEGARDTTHLVSGLDVMSTVCDYAGIETPPHVLGKSLRPLCEQEPTEWRDFVTAETHIIGRTLRTQRYKYVRYKDDPIEQLFDMQEDPWEMRNLYDDPGHADTMTEHRTLLDEWEARLRPVEPSPVAGHARKQPKRRRG